MHWSSLDSGIPSFLLAVLSFVTGGSGARRRRDCSTRPPQSGEGAQEKDPPAVLGAPRSHSARALGRSTGAAGCTGQPRPGSPGARLPGRARRTKPRSPNYPPGRRVQSWQRGRGSLAAPTRPRSPARCTALGARGRERRAGEARGSGLAARARSGLGSAGPPARASAPLPPGPAARARAPTPRHVTRQRAMQISAAPAPIGRRARI